MEKLTLLHVYRVLLFTSSIFIVSFWWRTPIVVFFLLILLFIELNRTFNWRYIKTSLLAMVFGPVAEAIAIAFSTWTYSNSQFGGIPIWLSPLWGIAALYFIAVAVFIGEKPSRQ